MEVHAQQEDEQSKQKLRPKKLKGIGPIVTD